MSEEKRKTPKRRRCAFGCGPATSRKEYRDANGKLYAIRHYCEKHRGQA